MTTRRGFLAASSLSLAACAQRRIADRASARPALPRLARVTGLRRPRDPQHRGTAAVSPGGIRGARGKAGCQDRDSQLRAWRRRHHAFLGHGATGRRSRAARRRARVRRDRLRRGGVGHRAALAGTRATSPTIYAREMPPLTTSNLAGGLWEPVSVFDHPRVTPEFRRQFADAARICLPPLPILCGRRLRRALAAAVQPGARPCLYAAAAGQPEQRGGTALSGSGRVDRRAASFRCALRLPARHDADRAGDLSGRADPRFLRRRRQDPDPRIRRRRAN